ncbi:Crp/Fnr family transcriptional regulator [Cohnella sp. AR92]|uniref:Crp/Fnr family transcriptional regulator n=1 Tax=Cohnella sp. AR92 TaxID=648716 RepID=UPI0013159922|nr:Crp/Fnr family transcriptional regulator [Cohnella sp. AR92]
MLPSDIQRIDSSFPFFSPVNEMDLPLIEIVTVTPSTPHSIREGHLLRHAMFVLSGSVRIHKIGKQGKEITLYRVQKGQCCALMMASILGETPYEASASIEMETEILLLPIPLFKRWMDTNPLLKPYIFKQITQRITSVTNLLENVAFQPIPYRIADYLIRQSDENEAVLKITHEQLAIELGTAREVVSRCLKDFVQKKILLSRRGRLQILDRSLLLETLNSDG